MSVVAHLTTVHARNDVRIALKECATLAQDEKWDVYLLVADSLGDESAHGYRIIDMGLLPEGRLRRVLSGSYRAFRLVRRLGAGLVHFHDPELIPVCLLLRAVGVRVVYDVHEDMSKQILVKSWLPRWSRSFVSILTGGLEQFATRWFSGVVAATPRIASRFPEARTVLVRNYPLLSEFQDDETPGQRDRPATFAYVGVLAKIRGAEAMVAAMESFPEDSEVTLKLAGNYSPSSLEAVLASQPGWCRVEYLGWLDRRALASLFLEVRAGLVVLQPTSNYLEALPVKLFEYMAAGLPVIASDFPIWREIVDGAKCGLLVDPVDPADIAEAMRWVLAHPDDAEQMGARGREATHRWYNWSQEARALSRFYASLDV